jgi:hypothetical protein
VGTYYDVNFVSHGFRRDPSGKLTNLDPPGSTFTVATGINPAEEIVGQYCDVNFVCHGFLFELD